MIVRLLLSLLPASDTDGLRFVQVDCDIVNTKVLMPHLSNETVSN